ncbi:MAG: radical SAM/SPASM domain-containing protein [Bryobacteraceae bacterium]|nr:radical SAM/SPASM domain-containing protein [Bryobacteraceae bacterium]
MRFLDTGDEFRQKRGRIILAGGEILLDAVRETVLYPGLRQLRRKYLDHGGVELIVQTTGDILTRRQIGELLDLDVSVISISGMDAYHAGLEEESVRERLRAKLTGWFQEAGMREWVPVPDRKAGERYYHFFGATPESWIGKLWPRGRAMQNEHTRATLADNFCNGWSGGLNFLAREYGGSEVSIDPEGNVYPCCIKTRLPVGSLLTDKLDDVLDRLVGNPVYEAISMGHPERMGIVHGWTVEKFYQKSRVVLPSGREYQNLCIGCDAFHNEALGAGGPLVQIGA